MQEELRRLVTRLELQPHPEGGYFRETYRSPELLTALPERFEGPRSSSTTILFLLPHGHTSSLHRIKSDEVWHFYLGSPLRVVSLDPDGSRKDYCLGSSLDAGQTFQAVVPAGHLALSSTRRRAGHSLAARSPRVLISRISRLELGMRYVSFTLNMMSSFESSRANRRARQRNRLRLYPACRHEIKAHQLARTTRVWRAPA